MCRRSFLRPLIVILLVCLGCPGFGVSIRAQIKFRGVIVIIGPPGSGKSTQSELISRKYKIPIVSAAELLKKEVGKKSEIGKQLKVALESGMLVNDETLNGLVRARVRRKDALEGFVLDGYPQSVGQARFLDSLIQERGLPTPLVIQLDIPEKVVRQRTASRNRPDDDPKFVEVKLREYQAEIEAIRSQWAGRTIHRIDGTRTIPEVEAEVDQLITSYPR